MERYGILELKKQFRGIRGLIISKCKYWIYDVSIPMGVEVKEHITSAKRMPFLTVLKI